MLGYLFGVILAWFLVAIGVGLWTLVTSPLPQSARNAEAVELATSAFIFPYTIVRMLWEMNKK